MVSYGEPIQPINFPAQKVTQTNETEGATLAMLDRRGHPGALDTSGPAAPRRGWQRSVKLTSGAKT